MKRFVVGAAVIISVPLLMPLVTKLIERRRLRRSIQGFSEEEGELVRVRGILGEISLRLDEFLVVIEESSLFKYSSKNRVMQHSYRILKATTGKTKRKIDALLRSGRKWSPMEVAPEIEAEFRKFAYAVDFVVQIVKTSVNTNAAKRSRAAKLQIMLEDLHECLLRLPANWSSGGPIPVEICTTTSQLCGVPISDVTFLEGHTSEVYACAWSPAGSLLATGSRDSTARIWTIADGNDGSSLQNGASNVRVLEHVKSNPNEGVMTVDWNWDGTLLAAGYRNGEARIWSKKDGELRRLRGQHRNSVISVKWNKNSNYLLSGSSHNAIVWDAKTYECVQQFSSHSGIILDVDWRNRNSFATSSTDNMIHVHKIGESVPIKKFSGHLEKVNCIRWDPTGSLLASGSGDHTAKIWSMKREKYIHDLREHSEEVCTIRWSPTGPGTINPNQQLILASASYDTTVKLWNVDTGIMLQSLKGHRYGVSAIAFSPGGEYLASGSLDGIRVWSVKEGKMIRRYNSDGSIFEICWNREGDRISACTNKKTKTTGNVRGAKEGKKGKQTRSVSFTYDFESQEYVSPSV